MRRLLACALLIAGCSKDYGRAVLLTLVAPPEAMGAAPDGAMRLHIWGDDANAGHSTAKLDNPKSDGHSLFDGVRTETILYVPTAEKASTLSFAIWQRPSIWLRPPAIQQHAS